MSTMAVRLPFLTVSTAALATTVTYSGGPFTSLSFLHEQTANNIGFVISNVTVDVAAVPLPASLPLLMLGVGSIVALCRKRQA